MRKVIHWYLAPRLCFFALLLCLPSIAKAADSLWDFYWSPDVRSSWIDDGNPNFAVGRTFTSFTASKDGRTIHVEGSGRYSRVYLLLGSSPSMILTSNATVTVTVPEGKVIDKIEWNYKVGEGIDAKLSGAKYEVCNAYNSNTFTFTIPAGYEVARFFFYYGDPIMVDTYQYSAPFAVNEVFTGNNSMVGEMRDTYGYLMGEPWYKPFYLNAGRYYYSWRKINYKTQAPETEWSEWGPDIPHATEFGIYEVKAYHDCEQTKGYVSRGSREEPAWTFTSKLYRPISDKQTPTAKQLTYNFEEQELVSPGVSSQGTYYYRLGEDGEWSTTVPKATESGTYKVYWYIAGNADELYWDDGSASAPAGNVTVTINKLNLISTTMTVTNYEYVYDGLAHSAEVEVKYGEHVVPATYYTTTYQLHGDATAPVAASQSANGEYDITVTAVDDETNKNFTGAQTSTTTLVIDKFNLANALYVGGIAPQLYTGAQITPDMIELTMPDGTTPINPDEFDVSYGTNINAGTEAGTVTATAKSTSENYRGSITLPFDIQKRRVTVAAKPQIITYNSGEFKNSGTDNVTVTLDDSYTDGFSMETLHHALKSVILTCTETEKGKGTYNNAIIPGSAMIYDGDGAGTNDVTANYIITYQAADLTINAKDFGNTVYESQLSISGVETEYAWTGSAIIPNLKVRDNGRLLTNGASGDYTVAYSDNTAVGQATMTITFNPGGNYTYTGATPLQRTFDIYYAVTAYERTGDTNLYRTYYNGSEDLEIRDNTKFSIYKGAISSDKTKVVLTDAGTIIPSGNAVMLVATETPVKLYKASATSSTDFSDNVLLGGGTYTTALTGSERFYTFDGNAFVWATSGTMEANKAYINGISLPTSAPRLYISFGSTTGVSETLRVESEDSATAVWYTLDGRKLSGKPTQKGLYILNGRKVIVP